MHTKATALHYVRSINENGASLVAILLLLADASFIALHSMEALTPFLNNQLLSLDQEGSYPDVYQYLKWLWIIVLLAFVSLLRRSSSYLAWGLVFAYLLVDDAATIHEDFGIRLAANLTLTPPFGLRLQDLGELAVSAIAGMTLLVLVAWAYARGSHAFRKISQDLLLLMLALVVFGVAVDMAHGAVPSETTAYFILGVVEDGGELVVASLILWYVFRLAVHDEDATSYLVDLVRNVRPGRAT